MFSHTERPDGLNSTSLSQGYVLGAASLSREGEWNAHSKDRGGGEEPPIAGVQLQGQPAVTSSR